MFGTASVFGTASGTDTQPFSGNICNTDNGAFCTKSVKELAVIDVCCGVGGDYDDCPIPNQGAPQDVPYWVALQDTDRGAGPRGTALDARRGALRGSSDRRPREPPLDARRAPS